MNSSERVVGIAEGDPPRCTVSKDSLFDSLVCGLLPAAGLSAKELRGTAVLVIVAIPSRRLPVDEQK